MRLKALLALAAAFAAVSASLSIEAPARQARPERAVLADLDRAHPAHRHGQPAIPRLSRRPLPGRRQPPLGEVPEKGQTASRQMRADQREDRPALDRDVERERRVLRLQAPSDRDTQGNPNVVVVDGAQDGFDAAKINQAPPTGTTSTRRLAAAGVSANQVQAVWLKEAIAGEDRPFPKDMKALQRILRQDHQDDALPLSEPEDRLPLEPGPTAATRSRAGIPSRRPTTARTPCAA